MTKSRNRIEGEGGRVSFTQATTSGTSIDFSGIPDWVTRITIVFDNVSQSGSTNLRVQIGDSGGLETTGYENVAGNIAAGSTAGLFSTTGGFDVAVTNAAHSLVGTMVLERLNNDSKDWVATLVGMTNLPLMFWTAGHKKLSGDLTQVSLVAQTGVFDNGQVTLYYE